MSCDSSRKKYIDHNTPMSGAVVKALGGGGRDQVAQARSILTRVYETAKNSASTEPAALKVAEAKTRLVFDEMQKAGIKLPVHGDTGLPKQEAMFGYAALYDLLQTIRKGQPLPKQARQLVAQAHKKGQGKSPRMISAANQEIKGGAGRCRNCGRFTSPTKDHLCPAVESGASLSRKLQRALSVDANAYGEERLNALILAAQTRPIRMTHNLTGEVVDVTLDGLPLALATGFVPESWLGMTTPVISRDGRIVSVINPGNLPVYRDADYPDAIARTAAAYGLVVDPTTVLTAASTPTLKKQIVRKGPTGVSGGSLYDLGRFMGTEYRRRGSHGQTVSTMGTSYTVGDRSDQGDDWSVARHQGLAGPPENGVGVGRTLIPALDILTTGKVRVTGKGDIQVYDASGSRLLSVYSPKQRVVGDTQGTPNASAAQMAALLAHRMLHPENGLDEALARDYLTALDENGSPLRAADSAWLTLSQNVFGQQAIHMGGAVQTNRCPDCGQWAGDLHQCPNTGKEVTFPTAKSGFIFPNVSGARLPVLGAARLLSSRAAEVLSGTTAAAEIPNFQTEAARVAQITDDEQARQALGALADRLEARLAELDPSNAGMWNDLVAEARRQADTPADVVSAPPSSDLAKLVGATGDSESMLIKRDRVGSENYVAKIREFLRLALTRAQSVLQVVCSRKGTSTSAGRMNFFYMSVDGAQDADDLMAGIAAHVDQALPGFNFEEALKDDSTTTDVEMAVFPLEEMMDVGSILLRCPDCGQWTSNNHVCPARQAVEASSDAPAAPTLRQIAVSTPAPAIFAPQPAAASAVNVTVETVDATMNAGEFAAAVRDGLAAMEASVNVSGVTAPVDASLIADAIRDSLANLRPDMDPSAIAEAIRSGLAGMQANIQAGEIKATMDASAIAESIRSGLAGMQANIQAGALQVDAEQLAGALRNAQPATSNAPLDTTAIADAIRDGLQDLLDGLNKQPAPAPANIAVSLDASGLAESLTQAIAALPAQQQVPDSGAMDKVAEAMGMVATALQALGERQAAQQQPAAAVPTEEGWQRIADRLAETLSARPAQAAEPPARRRSRPTEPAVGSSPLAEKRLWKGGNRPPLDQVPETGQERILSQVVLPAPDPYWGNIDPLLGGQRDDPSPAYVPDIMPEFEINAETEAILARMSALLQAGGSPGENPWCGAYSIFGPQGVGKNTIGRQLAASIKVRNPDGTVVQGLPYAEASISEDSSMSDLIGAAVLEVDPETKATVSRPRLGKLGAAAATGSVVFINEITRRPKLATAIQSMLEDRVIEVDTPEGGTLKVPVHPSTIFVMTWNPGYEGDTERPGLAALSRTVSFRLGRPSNAEAKRRMAGFFAQLQGSASMPSDLEARRKEILAKEYGIPDDITPSEAEMDAAIGFVNDVGRLAGADGVGIASQIGLNSRTPPIPGPRELARFMLLGKLVGWKDAAEMFKVCCDQSEDAFREQWDLVVERFTTYFGADGETFTRQATPVN